MHILLSVAKFVGGQYTGQTCPQNIHLQLTVLKK